MSDLSLKHGWTRRLAAVALLVGGVWVFVAGFTRAFGVDLVLGILAILLALRLGTIRARCPACGKGMLVVKGDVSRLFCMRCGEPLAGRGASGGADSASGAGGTADG